MERSLAILWQHLLLMSPVMLVGLFLPIDLISHYLFGTEQGIDVLLSPTHLMMVSGMVIGFFLASTITRHWLVRAASFFLALFWVHIYLNMVTLYFRSVNFPFNTEFGVQNPLTGLLATMIVSSWLLVAPTVMSKRFGFHLNLLQWTLVNSAPVAVSALFYSLGSGALGALIAVAVATALIILFGRGRLLWPTVLSAGSFSLLFVLSAYWGGELPGWTPYAAGGVVTLSLFSLFVIATLCWGGSVVFGYSLAETEE